MKKHNLAVTSMIGMACLLLPEAVMAGVPDFSRQPMTIGKRLLAEKAYIHAYFLESANFSPELSYPIFLYYKSNRELSGMFGKSWFSPQLESSLIGNLWISPWGERISFPDASGRYELNANRIVGVRDLKGWEFTYANARLEKISSPCRRSIEFKYENDRLATISQQERIFVAIKYHGNTAAHLEINGIQFKIAYDQNGQLASIQRAGLTPIQHGYSRKGFLHSITHGRHTEKFVLDEESGLLKEDAHFSYKGSENSITLTDKAGYTQQGTWMNNIFTVIDRIGRSRKYEFSPTFDPAYPGRLLRISDDKNKTLLFCKYDENGKLLEQTDRLGNRLLLSYNAQGLPAALFRQAANSPLRIPVERIEYNAENLPIKVITVSEDGSAYREIRFLYNANRQVSVLERDNHSFRISYNPYGYPVSLTAKNGVIFGVRYDDFNRPLGKISRAAEFFSYNDAGLITEIQNQYEPEKTASFLRIEYDALGNPIHYQDHKKRSIRHEYNAKGQLVSSISPAGTRTSYLYDALGNLTQVTDPNGHLIRFTSGPAGMTRLITAEDQVNEQIYDAQGRAVRFRSYFVGQETQTARDISCEYDEYDRIRKIDFGNGCVQENAYDQWGHIFRIERRSPTERRVAEMKYDHFFRMAEKTETVYQGRKPVDTFHYRYEYNNRNQKIFLSITHNGRERKFLWNYDENGLLISQQTGRDKILYTYENGRMKTQTINGKEIAFYYNRFGLLERKTLAGTADLKYFYDEDGTLTGREFNGKRVNYQYDPLGQLLAATDSQGKQLERYEYDPAGNILKKIIDGKTSTFTYDKANQLKNAVMDGKKLNHRYDAAGRMVSDGETDFEYAWLNSVVKAGNETFSYHADGHLAKAGDERFLWDGLALAVRGDMAYLNEDAPTGGNPVLAGKEIIFTDLFGSSLGFQNRDKFTAIERTAFGASTASKKYDFFTGKPYVDAIGYNFLFRNYQPQYGKWSSADPLGYPDGWNNLSYVNNHTIQFFDNNGLAIQTSMGGKVAGAIWGYGTSIEFRIGTDTNSGTLKWQLSYYTGEATGTGVSASADVNWGSGTFGDNNASYSKVVSGKNISGSVSLNSDGSYSVSVEGQKGPYIAAVEWSSDGLNVAGGLGRKFGSFSTNSSIGMSISGELFNPYAKITRWRDIFAHAVFEAISAPGYAIAQTQIAIEGLLDNSSKNAENSNQIFISNKQVNAILSNIQTTGDTPYKSVVFTSNQPGSTSSSIFIKSNQTSTDDDVHIIRSSAEAANAEKGKPVAVVDPRNPPGKDYTIKVPPIPMIRLEIWDYAAEDGDTVEVLHNGKVIMSERTIYNKPFYVSVPAEGNFQVRGVHDGGGGITYAVRVVETNETLQNETASRYANRYTMEKMSALEYAAKIAQGTLSNKKKK